MPILTDKLNTVLLKATKSNIDSLWTVLVSSAVTAGSFHCLRFVRQSSLNCETANETCELNCEINCKQEMVSKMLRYLCRLYTGWSEGWQQWQQFWWVVAQRYDKCKKY